MSRLLSVVWYKVLPAQFGGQKGIAEFNQHLGYHHTLFCLCSLNNQPTGKESYTVLPMLPTGKSQVVSPASWRLINRIVKEQRITHLILEHSYYGLAGVFLKNRSGIKLVIHAHNIESLRFKALGKWWWLLLWMLEKYTHRRADLNLFKTEIDMEFAVRKFKLDVAKCLVVPFGLSRKGPPTVHEVSVARQRICKKLNINQAEKVLLFTASLDYAPNAKALKTIVETIIPILSQMTVRPFMVVACGRIILPQYRYLMNLKHEHYIYAGHVENIEDYFLAADIFINPVIAGGGIKVKMMDALAYNLPVVSTAHSARGVDLSQTGNKLKIVDDGDWASFCNKIIEAWEEHADMPKEFYETYQWSKVINPVVEKLNDI
jgi:hypothetical protein